MKIEKEPGYKIYKINDKYYSMEEIIAVNKFYQDCIDRGNIDQAVSWSLEELSKGTPEDVATAEWGRMHFKDIYEECLRRLPDFKEVRDDWLKKINLELKNFANIVIKTLYVMEAQ